MGLKDIKSPDYKFSNRICQTVGKLSNYGQLGRSAENF